MLYFIERVNIAVNQVKKKYPTALLYEADEAASKGATTKAADIDTFRVIFLRPEVNATIIIKSAGYGSFDELVVSPEP